MNISIQTITLDNFKCFRHKEITLGGDVTIRGRNGAGKTTIADAILWCLFGKNSADSTKFNIKTTENGEVIPNLEHAVTLVLDVDGTETIIKRVVKDKYTKKRGCSEQVFSGNIFEYYINGNDTTAGDFKKYIAELVSEEVFRYITSPTYFLSQDWKVQRDFLARLAGDITPQTIACGEPDLLTLIAKLESANEDITAYRKHLSYNIKDVKKKIEQIPIRLEEQNKALPEKQDWTSLTAEYSSLTATLNELRDSLAKAKSDGSDELVKKEYRTKIDACQKEIDTITDNIRREIRKQEEDNFRKVSDYRRDFGSTSKVIADITTKIDSLKTLQQKCNDTLKQCEVDTFDIRTKWAENQKSRLELPNDVAVCPTCGQLLPEDKLQEAVEVFRKAFADGKAKRTAALTERAEHVKKLRADAEKQIEDYNKEIELSEASLRDHRESLNAIQKALHAAEQVKAPAFSELLEKNERYAELQATIYDLQDKLNAPAEDNEQQKQVIADLTAKIADTEAKASEVNAKLANQASYERISKLIEDIKAEEKQFIDQLSDYEQQEDIAIRYQQRQNTMLETSINKHFKVVQFRLFRTVVNNGDSYEEPYCEAYVDGTAYHDGLNQAARLNAGLDVINTLCEVYNVSAPIIIDNAESTISIIPTKGQQIRLYVADQDLNIE